MFYRELIYQAVIFLVIKPMVLKKSELTLPSKMQNTPFRQGKTILTRGIVIIGCIRNVIWSSAFSIKSKLFAELLLVMISLLHRFLLSYTSLPFGFCLNNTTLLSFQIRSSIRKSLHPYTKIGCLILTYEAADLYYRRLLWQYLIQRREEWSSICRRCRGGEQQWSCPLPRDA